MKNTHIVAGCLLTMLSTFGYANNKIDILKERIETLENTQPNICI